jgi:F0F1-type ATP synthase assembly protein I
LIDPESFRRASNAAALASRFTASIGAGIALGWLINHFLGGGPMLILLFAFTGLILGSIQLIRALSPGRDAPPNP